MATSPVRPRREARRLRVCIKTTSAATPARSAFALAAAIAPVVAIRALDHRPATPEALAHARRRSSFVHPCGRTTAMSETQTFDRGRAPCGGRCERLRLVLSPNHTWDRSAACHPPAAAEKDAGGECFAQRRLGQLLSIAAKVEQGADVSTLTVQTSWKNLTIKSCECSGAEFFPDFPVFSSSSAGSVTNCTFFTRFLTASSSRWATASL